MGGHGGLNILPQKRWHVYNRDNRERVIKDEAAYEELQKAKRAKHQKAESGYRHAIMLARARGEPQTMQPPRLDMTEVSPSLTGVADSEWQGAQPTTVVQQANTVAAPTSGHGELIVTKRAAQHSDGHFNFWKEDELKAGNAEVKADERNERRRRGDIATQTSDARFDEKFKLAHAMHGRAHTPWYAAPAVLPSNGPSTQQPNRGPINGASLLAASVLSSPTTAALSSKNRHSSEPDHAAATIHGKEPKVKKHKERHKHKKEHKQAKKVSNINSASDARLRISAAQLQASVTALRKERIAREAQEQLRERQLLRQSFRS